AAAVCLVSSAAYASSSVNVYSARHYDTDLALYKDFTARTGIRVNLIEAASDTLIERIVNEGQYSPADILMTVDAGRLYRAEQRGIFAPVSSKILQTRVPEHLRHPDGLWFGLSKRARVIIYNRARGKPEGLESYQDLTKPQFKRAICVRSSSNIYNISLLASMVGHLGDQGALAWAKGVVGNLRKRPSGNDTANIRAVASGQCRISIVNSYYIARFIASGDPAGKKVGIIYPNQSSTGTHVNISGAGVLKHAPNRANAVRFLEYLTEARVQALFVAGNNEHPVVTTASTPEILKKLGSFKEDTINASLLGAHQAAAVRIFDRAGWR
ncbi:MAG: extracellular solute-binding protein, partial [Myxococcota bacterium]